MAKLDLDITVYSAAKYVKDFLQTPLSEAFKRIKFTEAKLELSTVPLAKGSNAVCLFVNDDGDAEVLEALAALGVKMIAMRCAGFDRIDLDACQRLGIQIARVPAYSPTAVAEFAVASMFAVLRHLCKAYVRVREGNYSLSGLVGSEVAHKTVGVVGTGIIGFHTCNNLVNMAKKVVAYDVVENPKVKELGIEYVSLDELFAQSDIISLHCPLMQATYHLIGEETVPKLKKGVLIVNTSRGGLIDTDAALAGLVSGQIGGMALDVYEEEDALFFTDWSRLNVDERRKVWDHKFILLKSFPSVLITPHCAFLTDQALMNIANTTIFNLTQFANDETLTNVCNPFKPQPK